MHKSQFTDPARALNARGSEKSGGRHASPLRHNWSLISVGIGYRERVLFDRQPRWFLALFFSNFVVSWLAVILAMDGSPWDPIWSAKTSLIRLLKRITFIAGKAPHLTAISAKGNDHVEANDERSKGWVAHFATRNRLDRRRHPAGGGGWLLVAASRCVDRCNNREWCFSARSRGQAHKLDGNSRLTRTAGSSARMSGRIGGIQQQKALSPRGGLRATNGTGKRQGAYNPLAKRCWPFTKGDDATSGRALKAG
jgi:hypothetical protein